MARHDDTDPRAEQPWMGRVRSMPATDAALRAKFSDPHPVLGQDRLCWNWTLERQRLWRHPILPRRPRSRELTNPG